jgi:uncharacterized membrane protein YeaQ/YmgE (transglycosylase-associated protein family)
MEIATLVHLVVWLIVVGLIFGILLWLINYVGLPEPFGKVARIILAIIGALMVIGLLLNLIGYPILR